VGLLRAALGPLWRNAIFQGGLTRPARSPPTLELDRDGVVLRGWALHGTADRALVYFGGNGERVEDNLADFDEWFTDRAVLTLAYRSYGDSEGSPSQETLVADAEALFDLAAAGGREVDVVGRSLGSGVAVQLAVRRPVRRLVLVTPFDSIFAVACDLVPWLPTLFPAPDRFDSAALVGRLECPVLVVRATEDDVVLPERTARLVEALGACEQVVIPEAGHNDLQLHPAYAEGVRAFLA
jgi:pimeloyl-ACP methyl ester carboxylesterase